MLDEEEKEYSGEVANLMKVAKRVHLRVSLERNCCKVTLV